MTDTETLLASVRSKLGNAVADKLSQRLDWKRRMLTWMIARVPPADKETFVEMLNAALEQVAMDSFTDAIYLADRIANASKQPHSLLIAKSLRDLYKQNWGKEAPQCKT